MKSGLNRDLRPPFVDQVFAASVDEFAIGFSQGTCVSHNQLG